MAGEAPHVEAGRGTARCALARQAGHGPVWIRKARRGGVTIGLARQAWQRVVRLGMTMLGKAGQASRGMTGYDATPQRVSRRGTAGETRMGMVTIDAA